MDARRVVKRAAVIGVLWGLTRMAPGEQTVDLADPSNRDLWFSHPVIGDVSYDAFVRSDKNPIYVGTPPYEWPVNGFLFRDPRSGEWYCHISLYPKGYWPAGPSRLLRSHDGGASWDDLGLAVQGNKDMFDGDGMRGGATCDATEAVDEAGYHLAYGWGKPDNSDGGLAYAFSRTPTGPFIRDPKPIHAESAQPLLPPGYKRVYASSIIRRRKDWLILASMSTPRNAGGMWAFVCLTAPQASGPYSPPTFIRRPQDGEWFPQPVEFCPAFVHEGFVYACLTSVALNRGYQLILRAPVEEAHNPQAWSTWQAGSVFHAEPIRSETYGIWGQSFSGFVDAQGVFHIMYPARNAEGVGTINLASRRWDRPYGRGFWLSGPNAETLGLVLRDYRDFKLEMDWAASGPWGVLWNYRAPLGPDRSAADAKVSPLSRRGMTLFAIKGTSWTLEDVAEDGSRKTLANGKLPAPRTPRRLVLSQDAGRVSVRLDDQAVCEVGLASGGGGIGLVAEKGTCLRVDRCVLSGESRSRGWFLLPLEGLIGAGNPGESAWSKRTSPFRFGTGYVGTFEGARAKWHFRGRSVRLWAPRGPDLGRAVVFLDAKEVSRVDFRAAEPRESGVVWSSPELPAGNHALLVVRQTGGLPVDCVEFLP